MIKHTYFNPTKMWDELSFIKLKLGRVLHLGPSWHGPIFMWAELAWAELVLGQLSCTQPINSMPNRLIFVGPDLGQNCLQRLSADNKKCTAVKFSA